jgi:DNA-binding NarL/FixJ family response regulator
VTTSRASSGVGENATSPRPKPGIKATSGACKQQEAAAEDPLLVAARSFAARNALSARESEIFLLFTSSGKTNKEIAADLGIGYPTVKLYWTRICKKLGCECSVQAVMMFLRDALLERRPESSALLRRGAGSRL